MLRCIYIPRFLRLAVLCFAKIRGGSAMKIKVFQPFILHCARLAILCFRQDTLRLGNEKESLSAFHFALRSPCSIFAFAKIRGGSAMKMKVFQPFILHCARLAVSLHHETATYDRKGGRQNC